MRFATHGSNTPGVAYGTHESEGGGGEGEGGGSTGNKGERSEGKKTRACLDHNNYPEREREKRGLFALRISHNQPKKYIFERGGRKDKSML